MRLTVIGAGPAYSDRIGDVGACYLVQQGRSAIVLDLGQGAFPGLASRIEPSTLDAVVISHLHPDHFVDLVPLRHYLRYGVSPPRRVRIVAPNGLAARLDGLHAEPGFTAAALDVAPLVDGRTVIGDFEVEARRVTHTDDSYAFRVTTGNGPGLVYSGDVGAADDLQPLLRPGDTLLVETSFGPGPVPTGAQHLDGPAVGRLAAAAQPSRVLLTHLQMGFEPAATIASVRGAFEGRVEMVRVGYETTI